jgi:hypothetical protein
VRGRPFLPLRKVYRSLGARKFFPKEQRRPACRQAGMSHRHFMAARIFLCVCYLVWACAFVDAGEESSAAAQGPFDQRVKEIANEVMFAVYNDILSSRERYGDLKNFDQSALSRNQYGIYSIYYQHRAVVGPYKDKPFEFGVTIVGLEDTSFNEFGRGTFNFSFPLLGLKFAGYERVYWRPNQFSIQDVIQKNGDPLLEEQKKRLPLKLSLKTVEDYYRVNEDIEFIVTLENISSKNLWVRELNGDTLYFRYGNAQWGAKETSAQKKKREKRFILEPGEKVYKKFVGSGFPAPREFEVYCSYTLTFQGVKPFSVLKVKVVEGL